MSSRVDNVLGLNINNMDDGDDISLDAAPPNPYLHYSAEAGEGAPGAVSDERVRDKSSRPKSGKKSSSSSSKGSSGTGDRDRPSSSAASRPKSASRTSRRSADDHASGGRGAEESYRTVRAGPDNDMAYPKARGLVDK